MLSDDELRNVLRSCPSNVETTMRMRWDIANEFARAVIAAHEKKLAGDVEPVAWHHHPDFVGGIKWSELELEWIRKRDAQHASALAAAQAEIQQQKGLHRDCCAQLRCAESEKAELRAEVERLKVESTNKNDWLVEANKWEAEAKAEQAKVRELVEALKSMLVEYAPVGIDKPTVMDNNQFGQFLKRLDTERDDRIAVAKAAIAKHGGA